MFYLVSGLNRGLALGMQQGLVSGETGSGSVSVPTDGPDDWYLPTESGHFTELGLTVPDYWALCDQESGDISPVIDTISLGDLVQNGTAPTYEDTITGWAAKAIAFAEGTGGDFRVTWSIAEGESAAMLLYCAVSSTTSNRVVFTVAGAMNRFWLLSAGTVRAENNDVLGTGSIDHRDIDTVRQLLWYRNADADESGGLTDLEPIANTHAEEARADQQLQVGGTNTPALKVLAVGIFKGANAEQDWATYLATLRGETEQMPASFTGPFTDRAVMAPLRQPTNNTEPEPAGHGWLIPTLITLAAAAIAVGLLTC